MGSGLLGLSSGPAKVTRVRKKSPSAFSSSVGGSLSSLIRHRGPGRCSGLPPSKSRMLLSVLSLSRSHCLRVSDGRSAASSRSGRRTAAAAAPQAALRNSRRGNSRATTWVLQGLDCCRPRSVAQTGLVIHARVAKRLRFESLALPQLVFLEGLCRPVSTLSGRR
jgi:hypothetical protein